jgi:hypothetical protein
MPLPFRSFPLACALIASCALAGPAAVADVIPVTIHLAAMNGSGETGVATLTAHGDQTVVELKMAGAPAGPQPAHFHTGTCDNYAPRPLYPLHPVLNGLSTTTLDVPVGTLTAGTLVINVHHSLDDIATIASCAVARPA